MLNKFREKFCPLFFFPSVILAYLLVLILAAPCISLLIFYLSLESLVLGSIVGIVLAVILLVGDLLVFSSLGKKKYQKLCKASTAPGTDPDEFVPEFEKLYKKCAKTPFGFPTMLLLAILYIDSGKAEKAVTLLLANTKPAKSFHSVPAYRPLVSTYYSRLFVACLRSGKINEAQSAFTNFEKFADSNAALLNRMKMNLAVEKGFYNGAEEFYLSEIKENDYISDKYMLAKLYLLKGEKEKALPILHELAENPKPSDKYFKQWAQSKLKDL